MPVLDPDPATAHWPKMPRIVNEAGKRLQALYGENGIPAEELKRLAEQLGAYGRDSVLPSDYCYNVINRASFSFKHRVLVRLEHGRYRYVGPNYPYTGPVFWRPKGCVERQVGYWQSGVCTLTDDPRK